MYLSTMDETTLLEPIAQFTNGDLLNMSAEEWRKQYQLPARSAGADCQEER